MHIIHKIMVSYRVTLISMHRKKFFSFKSANPAIVIGESIALLVRFQ